MKYRIIEIFFNIIVTLIITIALTICMLSIKNYLHIDKKVIAFNDRNINSVNLKVEDVYDLNDPRGLFKFFREKDSLERLKKFNSFLNSEFECIEFDRQNLLAKEEFKFKEEFRIDYGTPIYKVNDDIGISFKSYQIGKYIYDDFNLKNQVMEGNGFNKDSFIYKDNIIPVLLGYEYQDYVNIGDVIKFEYLWKVVNVEAVGYLKKDTMISMDNEIICLDQSIVMPFIDIVDAPQNKDDEKFQKLVYSQKDWCSIKVKDGEDLNYYVNKIDNFCKSLDLKYIVNECYASNYIKNVSNTLNSTKGFILIFSIIFLILMSIIFILLQMWSFNKNKLNYCICFTCGCSLIKIKIKVFTKIILQFFIAYNIAFMFNKLSLGYYSGHITEIVLLKETAYNVLYMLLFIILITCSILNMYINKINVYNSIKIEN